MVGAAELAPTLDRLKHRGPDDEGFLVGNLGRGKLSAFAGSDTPAEVGLPPWQGAADTVGEVLLGHRRLSILDLSVRGHQPMVAPDGKRWIVFNGEIYNYIELREELKELGHEFATDTDTEVILHAWQEWGEDSLHRLNGDWAFALLDWGADGGEASLLLARDRWGVKPLFYTETEEGFWFASEAKALAGIAVPFQPREHAVQRFLLSGELPAGHGEVTFFEGVRQIPPGGALRLTADKTEKIQWYDLREKAAKICKVDNQTALEELEQEMVRSVRMRLRADVPVGSCLSGGVDSSSIVGVMRQLIDNKGEGELHTFSAVYREDGPFNESKWIHRVVDHAESQAHYTYPDDVPLGEMFDRMIWHQDEPFQTASIFAQWCVMQEARAQGVVVMLDGQAADELFAGYQPGTYQEQFLEWLDEGRYFRFIQGWVARKFATRLPWHLLIHEFVDLLIFGATGVLKLNREQVEPLERMKSLAFRQEVAEAIQPLAQRDEPLLRAKMEEDLEKLKKWEVQHKKKPNDANLITKINKKKTLIASNRRKLARLNSSGFRSRLHRFGATSKLIWSRFGKKRGDNKLQNYLLGQTVGSSLQHLLRFEDRNSMAFSIEARVPFTDFELVEWAFTRANDYKIYQGWTKWVLRKAMCGRVPESILWRRDKIGFETPDVKMAQRLMAESGRDPVGSEFLQQYLDPSLMQPICDRVKDGSASQDEGKLVWRWMVLDSWQRQFSGLGKEKKEGLTRRRRDAEEERGKKIKNRNEE